MTTKVRYEKRYIQAETVRGEPRVYWVAESDGRKERALSRVTRDHRQAARWLKSLERDGTLPPQH